MADFTIKRGDRLPAIEMILRDHAGAPIPLDAEGVAVRVLMRRPGTATPTVSAIAEIVDAVGGRVRHAWAAADTEVPGVYRLEAEITYADGRRLTCPSDGYRTVEVLDDLG